MSISSILFTVHGVETLGRWQDEISPSFSGIDGLHHEPHKYGIFRVAKILVPMYRRAEVRRFATLYDKWCKENTIRPSIIAHSFGTYIVATALRRYREMEFDNVILCGSIVANDYPWQELLKKKVSRVRNELASEDRVVRLFRSKLLRRLIPGTGTSGIDGFKSTSAEVTNEPSSYTHSEYFLVKKHCNRYWRPFIRNVMAFTDLCWECSQPNSEEAWKQFNAMYTPTIRAVVRAIFASASVDRREALTDAVVIGVAAKGCEGIYDAERIALGLCIEIRENIRKRG